MGTRDGSIIGTIITIHMARKAAAAPGHAWPDSGIPPIAVEQQPMASLLVVLVVVTPPGAGLVAALRGAVEPLVHAPESVHAARIGGIRVVHGAVLAHERAHAWPFAHVGGLVDPGHRRVTAARRARAGLPRRLRAVG